MQSPDDEGSGARRAEPDASASGGVPSSVDSPTGSFFDPLDGRLPSEVERDRGEQQQGRRSSEVIAPVRRSGRGERTERLRRRPRGQQVHVRRKLRHIDPVGVLKFSAIFYALAILAWLLLAAVTYNVLEGLGLFEAIEKVNEGLVLEAEVDITLGVVLRWAAISGIVFGIAATFLNVLLAVLYNGVARLVGGIELTFIERDK